MDEDVLDGSGIQTPGISGGARALLALVAILGVFFGALVPPSHL